MINTDRPIFGRSGKPPRRCELNRDTATEASQLALGAGAISEPFTYEPGAPPVREPVGEGSAAGVSWNPVRRDNSTITP